MLDIPFVMRDPTIGMLTQFMSYSFAASNTYTIPLLQKPDAQRVFGSLMMMAMGAAVGPLRQLSRGEEIDWDENHLMAEALWNSGIGGMPTDLARKADAILALPAFEKLRGDRFRRKTPQELITGPTGGIANNMASFLSAALSGQMNEVDMRKGIHLFPYTGAWWAQRPLNMLVDSLHLPKNRAVAKRRNG